MQEKCVHFLKQRKLGTKPGYHFLDLSGTEMVNRQMPGPILDSHAVALGWGSGSSGLANCTADSGTASWRKITEPEDRLL